MPWKCSHVAQTPSQISRVQVGTEVRLRDTHVLAIDQPCLSEIIVHNAGRRTHLVKIPGAHKGKVSGLCWADENRVLSCGVDRNIKMWDVCQDAQLHPSEAGQSKVRAYPFHLPRALSDCSFS